MHITVAIIAVIIGGWLAFDGTRALAKGDYVTSRAGELGPWSYVVSMVGVNPRGTSMKVFHVILGAAWIISATSSLAGASFGRSALIGCSLLTLWYFPVGTILSIAEIALLILPAWRFPK